MEIYIRRLLNLGFPLSRASEICEKHRKNGDLEGLDQLIDTLEDSWSDEECG